MDFEGLLPYSLHMAFLSKHPYIIMRCCLFLFVFFILLFPFFFQGNVFSRQAFISIRWYFVGREVQVSAWSPGNSRWDIFHPQTFVGLADHPFFSSLAAWLNRLCRKAVIVINTQHPLHLSPVGYYREFIFFSVDSRRPITVVLKKSGLKTLQLTLSDSNEFSLREVECCYLFRSTSSFKLKHRVRVSEIWLASCLDDVCETTKPSDRSFVVGWPTTNFVATFK